MDNKELCIELKNATNVLYLNWMLASSLLFTLRINTEIYHSLVLNLKKYVYVSLDDIILFLLVLSYNICVILEIAFSFMLFSFNYVCERPSMLLQIVVFPSILFYYSMWEHTTIYLSIFF